MSYSLLGQLPPCFEGSCEKFICVVIVIANPSTYPYLLLYNALSTSRDFALRSPSTEKESKLRKGKREKKLMFWFGTVEF